MRGLCQCLLKKILRHSLIYFMTVDFLEMERKKQQLFYKIVAFVLVVVVVITALVLYVSYKNFTESGLFLEHQTCKLAIGDTYKLATTQNFNEIGLKISEKENFEDGRLKYTQLTNANECGDSLALWFDNKEDKKKFIYCLSTGDVIKLELGECEKPSPWETFKSGGKLFKKVFTKGG